MQSTRWQVKILNTCHVGTEDLSMAGNWMPEKQTVTVLGVAKLNILSSPTQEMDKWFWAFNIYQADDAMQCTKL